MGGYYIPVLVCLVLAFGSDPGLSWPCGCVVVSPTTPTAALCHDTQTLEEGIPDFFCLGRSEKVLDPAGQVSFIESRIGAF